MTLRRKTRIIVGTMFLGLIVILYFLSEYFLLDGGGVSPAGVDRQDVAIAYLMLMIVGAGLLFGIVTILLLEKQVLSKLTRLSNSIRNIGTSGDITARVLLPGTDELSVLAGTINGLLAAMEQSEGEMRELYNKERMLRQKLEDEINKRVEFTRALVHELKTPVTPIMASSELLLQKLKDEPLHGLAQNINQGANNLNRRIDELLDLARGEIGTLRLNPEPMNPRQLLLRIVDEEKPVAMRNGQALDAELPDSLPVIVADEERFQQVVLNLLNNAVKFTPPGGKITLRARVEGDNLTVEVQDTGIGISQNEQKVLFEPYRSLKSDRERLSGLGLGLSLSKKLVELHRGRIWVKSKKDKGSTFSFSIPLAANGQKAKVGTGDKS